MLYQHITDTCFEERLGSYGVSRARVDALLKQFAPDYKTIASRKNPGATPLLDLPSRSDDFAAIETLATEIRASYKYVVVAGTGGSGLSGRTLTRLAPIHAPPIFYYLDNIDPDVMDDVLSAIDIKKTCFLVVSRSGATAETLSQFYVLFEHAVSKLGRQGASERFFVITLPGGNPLRQSAEDYGLCVLDHDRDIGGRFSILTKVGLLPAAIAGLDIRALRRGAQTVVAQMDSTADPAQCYPAVGAALHVAFIENKRPITVMLPYSERLSGFSAWYRQSWAESLGKQGKGSTPIRAMGTTDQHSQLQLYLDGPKDKWFHMILLNRAGKGLRIPAAISEDLAYLRGKTTGDVMAAAQRATFETLARNRCPVRLFKIDRLGEEQMGALVMHFMLEIIFTASLLGVNPFDQPAVEESKQLAREYLLAGNL